jgi:diguanylate cyclase (GGDEF)-like protein/PAS domain S-box-containing protein
MNRLSFGSIRVRLILLVVVAIIPSLAIILLTGQESRRFSANSAQNDAMQLAVVASGNQDLLVETSRQMLAGLASLPELRREDSRTCSALFTNLLNQYKQYNNIIVVKPNGDLWCSGIPAGGSTNYADRGWFTEVMRTRGFVIGDYVMGRITKKPQTLICYPIIAVGGKVHKIIVAGFNLDWLNQFVAKTKLPPGAVLTVIDRNFTVLTQTLEPDKWVGQTVKQAPIVNAILTKKQGTLETIGIDGIKRLYAFAPLGTRTNGSVYVFIGIPASVAYAEANRILLRNLIALGLAAVLAFIVAWVGGNLFLLRRINTLLHTAKRLEDGDLSARTGITYGPGELSGLARAFDRMAESLEHDITERKQAEEALRSSEEEARRLAKENEVIAEIGRIITSSLNIDEVYERFAEEVRKLISLDRITINIVNPRNNTAITAYVSGTELPHRKKGSIYPLSSTFTEEVRRTHTSLLINEENYKNYLDRFPGLVPNVQAGFRSLMVVPLISKDVVIGVLQFRHTKLSTYSEKDLKLAERMGFQIAGAIANAQLFLERKQAEEALKESEKKYCDLYENAPDMYYSVDSATRTISECNETFLRITGFSKAEVIGRPIFELFDAGSVDDAKKSFKQFQAAGELRDVERRVMCKDGRIIHVSLNVSAIKNKDGNITHSRAIWRDITKRKEQEEMIRALSITDQLTGLYNRRGFMALAEQQLRVAERTKNGLLLLYADMDGLKKINDKLGHKSGDEAIVEVANVLREVFRKMDIIARMGGDEFAVLAPEASLEYGDMIKNRLQNQLNIHNSLAGRDYTLSLSIGTVYHDPATPSSLDDLISRADSLMYEQKRRKAPSESQEGKICETHLSR